MCDDVGRQDGQVIRRGGRGDPRGGESGATAAGRGDRATAAGGEGTGDARGRRGRRGGAGGVMSRIVLCAIKDDS